jgi:hypothetical protein
MRRWGMPRALGLARVRVAAERRARARLAERAATRRLQEAVQAAQARGAAVEDVQDVIRTAGTAAGLLESELGATRSLMYNYAPGKWAHRTVDNSPSNELDSPLRVVRATKEELSEQPSAAASG